MIRVSAIDHVNLSVADIDRSIDFYSRVFDFKVVEDGRDGPTRWAIIGIPQVALLALAEIKKPRPARGTTINHFGLVIDDLASVLEVLNREQVEIVPRGPDGSAVLPYPRSQSVYVLDPDNHEIELTTSFGGGLE